VKIYRRTQSIALLSNNRGGQFADMAAYQSTVAAKPLFDAIVAGTVGAASASTNESEWGAKVFCETKNPWLREW